MPLLYMPVALALLALAILALWSVMKSGSGCLIVAAFFAMLLLGYHIQRKDYRMICIAAHSPWPIFATDYLLVAIPLATIAVLHRHWLAAAAMIATAVLTGMIKPPRRRIVGFPVPAYIPIEAFEIRSGIRRSGGMMLAFYALAWATVWAPIAPLLFLWLCLFIMADFYRDGESTAILCSSERDAVRLLGRKLKIAAIFWSLAIAPVCIASAVINPQFWGIYAGFGLLSILNACLFPLAKYARYAPNERKGVPIAVGMSMIGVAVPLFAPLTPALLLRYYQLSVRQLNTYLYAYNR
jgi:hypothetical protein